MRLRLPTVHHASAIQHVYVAEAEQMHVVFAIN